MKIVTLQPAPHVDFITEDGDELTRLPYPFHVNERGHILRQDFWRGNPRRVVGFASRADAARIDVWWRDAWERPDRAIGMYVVSQNSDGGMATHVIAIDKVSVSEVDGADEDDDQSGGVE